MNITYNPATLPAVLREQLSRFGGLTLAELEMLSEMNGTPARPGMFDQLLPPASAKGIGHIFDAFQIAVSKGAVKQPSVLVQGFQFKYATRGATPGAIFVVETESGFNEYLGKFIGPTFMPVRACTEQQRQRILAAAANPLEAIIAFGKATGKCGVCNRTLTDPESIEAGIGPICKGKYGL